MGTRKRLIVSTAIFFAIVLLAVLSLPLGSAEKSNPVLGSAHVPVTAILFEDLQCGSCRSFSEDILPHLIEDYVAPGQIQFTIAPVGIITGSKILANAALEVYHLVPEKFLPYSKLLFGMHSMQGAALKRTLLAFADQLGGIDGATLNKCLDRNCHYKRIERNLAEARALMGKDFRVPTLYINDVRVSTSDYAAIKQEIERVLYGIP